MGGGRAGGRRGAGKKEDKSGKAGIRTHRQWQAGVRRLGRGAMSVAKASLERSASRGGAVRVAAAAGGRRE
jgi:hypothetical protein